MLKESTRSLKTFGCSEMSKKLDTEGRIGVGFIDEKAILAHERLAIVDPASGNSPV